MRLVIICRSSGLAGRGMASFLCRLGWRWILRMVMFMW